MSARILPVVPVFIGRAGVKPLLRGGPDPLRPCEGCPQRTRCSAPCERLAVLLPPPELRAPAEFHSEVLSGGISAGGSARLDAARVRVDERFLTQHAALVPEELAERWPDVVAAVLPYLGEWIERLPRAQRVLLRLMYREGMTLREARRARRITRQSAWVAYRRAKRRLVARIEALLAERLTDAKG